MRYPVWIEVGTDTFAWGVIVPDLPGCFSAGDTLEKALVNAEQAAAAWIEAVLDAGDEIPAPSQPTMPAKKGWALGYISAGS